MNIDDIIDMITDGDSFRVMATKLGVKLSTLHAFTKLPEHSARVINALELSSQSYDEKAEQVLIEAEGTSVEIMRARELAQHYRWKASKRSPKRYGDKLDLTTDGEKITTDYSKIPIEELIKRAELVAKIEANESTAD